MITLIPIGDVDLSIARALEEPLAAAFGEAVSTGRVQDLPPECRDAGRRQYHASLILDRLPPPRGDDRVLAVADVDLFAPGLNFVFGQADVGGRRALISVSRLRQEFYGLPPDGELFKSRVLKEAVHELGHTRGLGHCAEATCVMRFSNSLADTDFKRSRFCARCQRKIGRS